MLLSHECPVCKITHEKECTPEPDQLCDTCKIKHYGTYIIVEVDNAMQIPIKNKENKIEFYDDVEIADFDRIYYQTDHDDLLKVIKL